jgi:hypothetical protein
VQILQELLDLGLLPDVLKLVEFAASIDAEED